MAVIGFGIRNAHRPRELLHGSLGVRLSGLFALCFLSIQKAAAAEDLGDVVDGLQQHYAHVETISGSFKQTYLAPGIDQVESGQFWLKKPGLMRWEYRHPEEKLFVADGHEASLYVPQDGQVTVQPLTPADLRNTPLKFLLGTGSITKDFGVSWETQFQPKASQTYLIRLTPRRRESEYSFLVLELEKETWDLRRILIREESGNTSEFFFTDVKTNVKVDKSKFRFKWPKGVEVIRSAGEQ
jgi:outer membrane lipoprotein carrier protein